MWPSPCDHVRMALLALDAALNVDLMVEGELGAHLYVAPCLEVAGTAARDVLLLPFVL